MPITPISPKSAVGKTRIKLTDGVERVRTSNRQHFLVSVPFREKRRRKPGPIIRGVMGNLPFILDEDFLAEGVNSGIISIPRNSTRAISVVYGFIWIPSQQPRIVRPMDIRKIGKPRVRVNSHESSLRYPVFDVRWPQCLDVQVFVEKLSCTPRRWFVTTNPVCAAT